MFDLAGRLNREIIKMQHPGWTNDATQLAALYGLRRTTVQNIGVRRTWA